MSHHPDPGVSFGAFRVLPISTGGYTVCDTRKPPGYMRVMAFPTLQAATAAAKKWFDAGHGALDE